MHPIHTVTAKIELSNSMFAVCAKHDPADPINWHNIYVSNTSSWKHWIVFGGFVSNPAVFRMIPRNCKHPQSHHITSSLSKAVPMALQSRAIGIITNVSFTTGPLVIRDIVYAQICSNIWAKPHPTCLVSLETHTPTLT